MRRQIQILIAAFAIFSSPMPAQACGLDGASSIGLAVQRAVINWRYPATANISKAVKTLALAGHLPVAPSKRAAHPFLLHKYGVELKTFAGRVTKSRNLRTKGFDVLYIGPMLWTAIRQDTLGVSVKVHAAGPQSGLPLLVTERPVIRALIRRSMTAAYALSSGLITLHGSPTKVAMLRAELKSNFATLSDSPLSIQGEPKK